MGVFAPNAHIRVEILGTSYSDFSARIPAMVLDAPGPVEMSEMLANALQPGQYATTTTTYDETGFWSDWCVLTIQPETDNTGKTTFTVWSDVVGVWAAFPHMMN